jgi:hypothetical protein
VLISKIKAIAAGEKGFYDSPTHGITTASNISL